MERYQQANNVVAQTAPASAPPRERVQPSDKPRLRIAMLAPPWIPIPPPGYGGIEFVVALLTDALVGQGHEVELFCAPGSRSRAKVRPLLEAAHPERIGASLFEADHVSLAFDAVDQGGFDVLHDHSGFTALAMAHRVGAPMVHTVHGPFDHDTSPCYARHGAKVRLACISRSQAGMAPAEAGEPAVVYNPIDIDSWPVGLNKQDFLLWVGRFVPEKGPHRAIRVARTAGRPLVLAGVVQPGQERFFANEIQPLIDGETVRYVGEVGGTRKQQLFADAAAFLMPIRWPEPFGMVIVEAIAAGTPVLAFRQGAAPEIIENGVNGLLVEDEEEMAAAVDRVGAIDPMTCRRSAERFAPDHIATGYEAVYREAIAARRDTGRLAGAPTG